MRVSRCVPQRIAGPSSQPKKMALDVDLNRPPSDCSHSSEVDASTRVAAVQEMREEQQRSQPPPVTIDVETIDDDVVVLPSSRAFSEAKNNLRRRSRSNFIDLELESSNRDAANNRYKRQRIPPNQPIINCESYVILERSVHSNSGSGYGRNIAQQTRMFVAPPAPPPPPPPLSPPPPEPTFSCPVCMGPLVDEVSTKCGHIFCKACIKKALSVQSKCPTCRKKVTMRGTIRVYLPKTS
ncbi:hypothetical protein vseg_003924 [Gypsophila vaccaria]